MPREPMPSPGVSATIGARGERGIFFRGILLIGLVDNLIPSAENPHEIHSEKEIAPCTTPTHRFEL